MNRLYPWNLASALARFREYPLVVAFIEAAISIAREVGDTEWSDAAAHLAWADVAIRANQPEVALVALARAHTVADDEASRQQVMRLLAELGPGRGRWEHASQPSCPRWAAHDDPLALTGRRSPRLGARRRSTDLVLVMASYSGRMRDGPNVPRSEETRAREGRVTDDRCPEAPCNSEPQRDREDERCYYHAKIWDGLIEREPRKKGGAPREFLDAGGGRLVQIQ